MYTGKWRLCWLAQGTFALALMLTIGACETQQTPAANRNLQGKAAAQAPRTPGMVPLVIELPKPMFISVPQPRQPRRIEIENLESPRSGPRPALMVPQGTKLISFNQPVTSSDKDPVMGEPNLVTDGDKEGMDGSWVELTLGVQWVQIDLGQPKKIYAVVIWHEHRQAVVYKDVVVQIADDPDFVANVRTLFNNDIDDSVGLGTGNDMHYVETNEGKLIPVDGAAAQYVRLYSNGNTANDQNYYTEVEVYGALVE